MLNIVNEERRDEILLKTSGLANIIREGNTPMLLSVIQGGESGFEAPAGASAVA